MNVYLHLVGKERPFAFFLEGTEDEIRKDLWEALLDSDGPQCLEVHTDDCIVLIPRHVVAWIEIERPLLTEDGAGDVVAGAVRFMEQVGNGRDSTVTGGAAPF